MRILQSIFVFSVLSCAGIALAADSKAFPVKYEGGSLPLSRKVTATLGADEIVLSDGHQRVSVPASSITEIARGSAVHKRFGASVLPRHFSRSESLYVGVSWLDGSNSGNKTEAIFRLSPGEYRDFLSQLEHLTGKKAVDTNQTPTVVRYGL